MTESIQDANHQEHLSWLDRQLELQAKKVKTSCYKPLSQAVLSEGRSLDLQTYLQIDQALEAWTVDEFKALYKDLQVTPYQVTQYLIKRIGIYNPQYHAITQLSPLVFQEAKGLLYALETYKGDYDALWEDKPLWGIPLVVKDNIATGPDMANTAGAYALLHATTRRPSTVVRRLKDAGALVVGKANLSEWANFMTLDSSNGYSALGGQTINPHGSFDVGGSSSGSCVAVAAKLVPLALGTETAGSLVYPASQNRVVAIKPTVGAVSRDLVVPISDTQDTPGPIANTVRDAALLLQVLSGRCEGDIKTHQIPEDFARSLVMPEVAMSMSKKIQRIGLISNPEIVADYRDGDAQLMIQAVKDLQRLGYEVVPIEVSSHALKIPMFEVMLYEFYRDVNRYLASPDVDTVLSLEDLVKYNEMDPGHRAHFGQTLLTQAIDHQKRPQALSYEAALKRSVFSSSTAIYQALKSVDVLMTISNYATVLYAAAGYPAINVPMGQRLSGEPVGLTFFAGAFDEGQLIQIASHFERDRTCLNV